MPVRDRRNIPKSNLVWLRNNGLTIALTAMFLASLLGMVLAGWRNYNSELAGHGLLPISLLAYFLEGDFHSALLENWESEFLQMATYVILTAMLFQKGSAESRDPNEPAKKAGESHPRTVGQWIYAHSLGLALGGLFIICLAGHLLASAYAAAAESQQHGKPSPALWEHLFSSRFWFESFQNWQSEFLSTAVLVVLSIFLRYQGSPESKPVNASNSDTGA